MTISPLLQARLNKNSTNYNKTNLTHELIYEDLRRHANDVKPNEAKAKLIKQGPVSSAFSAVADTIQDGKNFTKAVKTGKLGDNNLGRINDLGMKIGAVLIAAFLASGAKTKTDAIMKFIGSGTFFATMALWPKLFINLPARLVHGFNIGQRYISAQGDKKDFFLDNQFLPWDAYSKDEMTAIGKRTGIDINSENGQEKIQRKMQKTALQNRTLWMATAGFATPLITSVIGNFVTPKVQDAVIKHGYNKTNKILSSNAKLNSYLNAASYDFRNQKALEALFNEYQGKALDDTFFKTLANMLEVSAPEYKTTKGKDGLLHLARDKKTGSLIILDNPLFKDSDNARPIEKNSAQNTVKETDGVAQNLVGVLKNMYSATSRKVDTTKLSEALKGIQVGLGSSLFDDEAEIKDFISSLGEKPTLKMLQDKLQEYATETKGLPSISAGQLNKALKETITIDNTTFFNKIKEYNSNTLAELRGRLKAYLNLLNPVIGDNAESVYTKEYHSVLDKIFSQLDLQYSSKDAQETTIKSMHNSVVEDVKIALSKFFSSKVPEDLKTEESKQAYQEFLKSFITPETYLKKDETVDGLIHKDVLGAVIPQKEGDELTSAIFGGVGKENSIFETIECFVTKQKANLLGTQAQPIICANFERRIKDGTIGLEADEIEAAKDVIYNGNLSNFYNNGHITNKTIFNKILNAIFNKDAFDEEAKVLPSIKDTVEHLKNICTEQATDELKYKRGVDIASRIKEKATSIYNNKTWARIFIPATAALIAITLLVQPFFGKIDDEYREKGGKV